MFAIYIGVLLLVAINLLLFIIKLFDDISSHKEM